MMPPWMYLWDGTEKGQRYNHRKDMLIEDLQVPQEEACQRNTLLPGGANVECVRGANIDSKSQGHGCAFKGAAPRHA